MTNPMYNSSSAQAVEPVVSFHDVFKNYGTTKALQGVNLGVQPGTIMGLLGPNGSGKTTFLKHISGLILPTSGAVKTFGSKAENLSDQELLRIGYVSQTPGFMEWMTVGEIIDFVQACQPRWNDALAKELIEAFEIDRRKKVASLSTGHSQRLAIMLGVVHEPDLLLLDEPAASLDPIARQDFLDLLMSLVQNPNRTIIISSHILTDVEKIIDQVLILDNGQVHCCQPLDELRDEYFRIVLHSVGNQLPEQLKLSGLKTLERDDKQAVATVHNPDRNLLKREVDLIGCTSEIRNLDFEEIYRLVVTGK